MNKIFESYIEYIVNEWNISDTKIWSFKLKDGRILDVFKVDLNTSKSKDIIINFKVNEQPVRFNDIKDMLKPIYVKKIETLMDLVKLDNE